MTRFKSGDLVVITHLGSNRFIGKVGVLEHISPNVDPGTLSHLVRFLQPTDRGERTHMFSEDELAKLTETKLDKLPYDLVP